MVFGRVEHHYRIFTLAFMVIWHDDRHILFSFGLMMEERGHDGGNSPLIDNFYENHLHFEFVPIFVTGR